MAEHRKPSSKHRPPAAAAKTDPRLRHLKDFVVEEIEISGEAPIGPRGRRVERRRELRWLPALKLAVAAVGLALLAVVAALITRSAWPTDETRLLASAWEMRAHGDWLLPRFNGTPLAVAPMFLWLVQAGWLVFGTVEWWPRLLPAVFMIASLFVTARMAALLWPAEEPWSWRVPLVLLGSFYWLASATLLTSNFLTVLFTLLAVHALLWMWRTRDQRVWLLLSLELGLGLLASGGLIILYVLPVALLAPLWTRGTPTMPWKYWYVDIGKATFLGFVIFAAWFVPAAGRVPLATLAPVLFAPLATHGLDLYAGSRPWWWPLALLPVLAFPWSLWPLPWLRLWHIRREPISNGLAFCMTWITVTVALALALSWRQPQLLLPMVPAMLLITAWLILDERHAGHDHSRLLSTMIFPLMLLGALLAVLPKLPHVDWLPDFIWQMSPLVGVAVIGVGVAVGSLRMPALEKRVTNMTVTVTVLATFALLALGWQFNSGFDVGELANRVAEAQHHDQAVAFVGPYAGQLHFSGRLGRPLELLQADEADIWVATHPQGLIASQASIWQPHVAGAQPLYTQEYDDGRLALWSAATLQPPPLASPAAPPAAP